MLGGSTIGGGTPNQTARTGDASHRVRDEVFGEVFGEVYSKDQSHGSRTVDDKDNGVTTTPPSQHEDIGVDRFSCTRRVISGARRIRPRSVAHLARDPAGD
jgi:hypothetical protein